MRCVVCVKEYHRVAVPPRALEHFQKHLATGVFSEGLSVNISKRHDGIAHVGTKIIVGGRSMRNEPHVPTHEHRDCIHELQKVRTNVHQQSHREK